jgi:hypothetical protein
MPSERYATAVEFARDVARAVAGAGAAAATAATEAATQIIGAQRTDVTAPVTPTRVRAATPPTPTTPRPTAAPRPPARKKPPVVALGLAAVVLVGAGITVFTVLGGGNGAVTDLDSAATVAQGDTQPSGSRPSRGRPTGGDPGGQRAGTQTQPSDTSGGETPARTAVDTVALSDELRSLLDRSDDASVIPRLTEIVGDERVPLKFRADAAAIAANAYSFQADAVRACQMIRRARDWVPTSTTYATTFERLGCT